MQSKGVPIVPGEAVSAVYTAAVDSVLLRPLVGSCIQAGFPSPAQDYIEHSLDLNEHLISHPVATFFVRVQGLSMVNAGIFPDDILIVDRSLEPRHNSIIIAAVDGELTVKRLSIQAGCWQLLPENPEFSAFDITEDTDFSVWGVVTYAIHRAV
ncbi:MAG: translesion error-prone DNA polymerase V autoproteolytic subunit [Candidatus Cloacimonetes bacterium]|nr:translesion error-prone DNA polymerase V autoproteolytic subunit [Candidatus Cloacimonadota bacterium]